MTCRTENKGDPVDGLMARTLEVAEKIRTEEALLKNLDGDLYGHDELSEEADTLGLIQQVTNAETQIKALRGRLAQCQTENIALKAAVKVLLAAWAPCMGPVRINPNEGSRWEVLSGYPAPPCAARARYFLVNGENEDNRLCSVCRYCGDIWARY